MESGPDETVWQGEGGGGERELLKAFPPVVGVCVFFRMDAPTRAPSPATAAASATTARARL